MGVEHSFKDEDKPEVMRCPKCEHLSTEKFGESMPYTSFFPGLSDEYFVCKNPKCNVERIYAENAITLRK
jgi:hypothetical protein